MNQVTNSIIPPEVLATLSDVSGILSTVAVVVFLAFVLWGAFQGYRRSIFRQGVHLAVTLILAAISLIVVSNFCGNIIAECSAMTTEEFLAILQTELEAQGAELPEEALAAYANIDLEMVGYVLALVVNTLIAPIVFTILFVLLGGVGKIVTSIGGLFVPKGRTLVLKLLGVLGGVIEGAVIAGIILLPVVGVVNITGDAVDVVRDSEDEALVEVVDVYDEYVAPLEENIVIKTVGALGGDAVLKNFATVEIDGIDRDLRDEIPNILRLGLCGSQLANIDMTDGLSYEEKAIISALVDGLDDSVVISKIACGGLNMYAEVIEQIFAEMPEEEKDPMTLMVSELLSIFGEEKTNTRTLGKNLNTFKNVLFIIADNGLIDAGDKFVEILASEDENGVTVLKKLTNELEANENTAHIVPLLTKMMVSTMVPEGSEEIPEEVIEGVKDSLTQIAQIETEGREKEEVKADVEETVTELLGSFDITIGDGEDQLPQETADALNELITEELMNGNLEIPVDENGQVSDADLLDFLVKYAGKLGVETPEVPEEGAEEQGE